MLEASVIFFMVRAQRDVEGSKRTEAKRKEQQVHEIILYVQQEIARLQRLLYTNIEEVSLSEVVIIA